MRILSHLLVLLVALTHAWFMVLEMVLWDHPVGRRIFDTTPEFSAYKARLTEEIRVESIRAAEMGA